MQDKLDIESNKQDIAKLESRARQRKVLAGQQAKIKSLRGSSGPGILAGIGSFQGKASEHLGALSTAAERFTPGSMDIGSGTSFMRGPDLFGGSLKAKGGKRESNFLGGGVTNNYGPAGMGLFGSPGGGKRAKHAKRIRHSQKHHSKKGHGKSKGKSVTIHFN